MGLAGRERLPALLEQALEAVEVKVTGSDVQQVAGCLRDEHLGGVAKVRRLEGLAESGDVDLDELLCGSGWLIPPELVDQPIARHDLVRVQEQHGEQRALLWRPY